MRRANLRGSRTVRGVGVTLRGCWRARLVWQPARAAYLRNSLGLDHGRPMQLHASATAIATNTDAAASSMSAASQVWERDLISLDDCGGEYTLPLGELCRRAVRLQEVAPCVVEQSSQAPYLGM